MSEERFTPASRLAAMDVGSTWTANGVSVTRTTLDRWTVRDETDSGYYASTIDADHAALVAFAVAERIAANAQSTPRPTPA